PNAGFTDGTPWLPVAPDYPRYNVAVERDDPGSMLTLCRQLLALRRESPALNVGSYSDVPSDMSDIFSFMREHEGERLLVVLNFSHEPRDFRLPGAGTARIALSTVPGRSGEVDLGKLSLAADEGVILRL